MRVALVAVIGLLATAWSLPVPAVGREVTFTTGGITRLGVNIDPAVTIGSTGWSPTAQVSSGGVDYQPELWVRDPGTVYLGFAATGRGLGEIASDACQFTLRSGAQATLVASFTGPNWQDSGEFGVEVRAFNVSVLKAGPLLARVDCGVLGTAQVRFPKVTLVPSAPRGDFLGVSVNAGDLATNSTDVLLNLDWRNEDLFDKVMVSNDGGFGKREEFVLDGKPVRWTLQAAGTERLPKTVYVRFHSPYSGEWSSAASDDIILDTVAPTIVSADSSQLRSSKTRAVTVQLNAKDDRSGVVRAQFRVGNRNIAAEDYSKRITVQMPKSATNLKARVSDGAGNWSKWKSVTKSR
jgi:hypothetical protein